MATTITVPAETLTDLLDSEETVVVDMQEWRHGCKKQFVVVHEGKTYLTRHIGVQREEGIELYGDQTLTLAKQVEVTVKKWVVA